MKVSRSATLTKLHEGLCGKLVMAPEKDLDVITSVDVQMHNTISEAESMEWGFDLKSMWLTPSRWSMMVKQYLDPEELQAWIAQCSGKIGTRGRGIAVLRTRQVKPRGGAHMGNKETRRWGSCMLALSYKAIPAPQITLYSRTSYLGYIGALDLSVAWMAARYLGHEIGLEPEEFRFVWMNEALQWHNFKSLAYMLNHNDEAKRELFRAVLMSPKSALDREQRLMIANAPAIKLSRVWLQKLLAEDEQGDTYGDMSYNTYRRIRRRFHTEVLGYEAAQTFEGWSYHKKGDKAGEQKEFFKAYKPLPHTLIQDCDFKAIGMPFGRTYGVDFEGGFDDVEDDE